MCFGCIVVNLLYCVGILIRFFVLNWFDLGFNCCYGYGLFVDCNFGYVNVYCEIYGIEIYIDVKEYLIIVFYCYYVFNFFGF